MKKLIRALVVVFAALLFAACGGTDAAPDEPFVWPDSENPFYGETLTIATNRRFFAAHYFTFAQTYMQRNPGVTIEFEFLDDNLDHSREQMAVQLMAGTAPTLIHRNYADQFMPMAQTMFADWNVLMAAHPEFDEADWVMNVFSASEVDGRLLAFPLAFGYLYVVANSTVPGLADALHGRQTIYVGDIMEIYGQYRDTTDEARPLYIGNFRNWHTGNLWALMMMEDDFFDFKTGFVNFSGPEFIETISRIRDWTRNAEYAFMFYEMGNRANEIELSQTAFFRVITNDHLEYLGVLDEETIFVNPMRLTNRQGELFVHPGHSFFLNAGATHIEQALALDFIMFMAGHNSLDVAENQTRLFIGEQSTHRELNSNEIIRGLPIYLMTWYNRGPISQTTITHITERLTARAQSAADMPMAASWFGPRQIQVMIIIEVYSQFHDGLITAEAAANDLQNRITLMLMEMD